MKYVIFFLLLFTVKLGLSQSKIKIVLVGVMHFDNPGLDVINPKGDNMLAAKRQQQIESITAQLAAYRFDKIFIEAMPSQQSRFDSLYQFDLANQLQTKADERRQIAFRLASKLKHKKLYCVDAPGDWFFDSVMNYLKKKGQADLLQREIGKAQIYVASLDSLLLASPLSSFIRYLNEPEQLSMNHSFYNNMLALIGDDNNYVGADLVGEWYKRNVRIYSNVVRRIEKGDKRVFLLFGQGHIFYLKQLFAADPNFELVEFKDIVK